MERALEASVRVQAEPKLVVEILCSDPPGILTGRPARDTEAFAAELAVDLGGGVSLAHEVDVAFGRLPNDGAVGRFSCPATSPCPLGRSAASVTGCWATGSPAVPSKPFSRRPVPESTGSWRT